jgi:hypothetical protein
MYQNREIAVKAFHLRTSLSALEDEAREFLEVAEESNAPDHIKSWARRVQGNVARHFKPAIDNLDQVRFVLDPDRQGSPK